ncbi:pafB domain protein [Mycobacterium xenopi 4042]|uniref:PafB domain protein n=1 Tax=Mycobacterium xenopi 4042 TaxID=1299334 RepID=X8BGH0_MYCXE|nr:pafB domain protein [Mycobacterium xenopi 4042]
MATSKVERLTNLVIALLSTRGYITAEKIRSTVAGYSDSPSDEAFSRMFERDKSELRDLGIPLETGRVSALDPPRGIASTGTPTRFPGRVDP